MTSTAVVAEELEMTEIGLLPSEWTVAKLVDHCSFVRGTEPGSNSYNRLGKGRVFIRVGNIAAGIQDWVFTTSPNIRTCAEEDILMTFDGSPGVVVKGYSGAYSSGIRKMVPLSTVDRAFLYYVLQTQYVQGVVQEHSTGVTIKHAGKALPHIVIPLPPLTKQRAIAYVLSRIQTAIEKTEAVIKTSRELKKSLMKHLFTYGPVSIDDAKNVPLKETEIGPVPEEWEVKPLVDIATLQRGKDLPKQKQVWGKYPVVGSSGIMAYHNQAPCKGPGVVTGRSGSIGNITYVEEDYWPHNTGLYVKDFHKNNPKFTYYLLHLVDFKKYATGVSVPTLNRNFVHAATLPVAPGEIQQHIADILTTADIRIEMEENRKRALEALFKTLLSKLMAGKIRVDNLEVPV